MRQVESENLAARQSAIRVLCAMAAANAEVCHAVASRVLPVVCSVCQKLSQVRNCEKFSQVGHCHRNKTGREGRNAYKQLVLVGSCHRLKKKLQVRN